MQELGAISALLKFTSINKWKMFLNDIEVSTRASDQKFQQPGLCICLERPTDSVSQ